MGDIDGRSDQGWLGKIYSHLTQTFKARKGLRHNYMWDGDIIAMERRSDRAAPVGVLIFEGLRPPRADTSMSPIRHSYLPNFAEPMPCLRQTSAIGAPLSNFFNIPMICAYGNTDCFIVRLLACTDSAKIWRRGIGSHH